MVVDFHDNHSSVSKHSEQNPSLRLWASVLLVGLSESSSCNRGNFGARQRKCLSFFIAKVVGFDEAKMYVPQRDLTLIGKPNNERSRACPSLMHVPSLPSQSLLYTLYSLPGYGTCG